MLRLCRCLWALPAEKKAFMELVKTLRYRTEAPISDCSAALKEADGDMEAAVQVLRKRGAAKAVKKGDRVTEQGFVVSCTAANPADGAAIITVCSETDFAARNTHFLETCVKVRRRLESMMEASRGAVLADAEAATRALSDATAEELRAAIAVLGENVRVRSVTPLRIAPHVSDSISIGTYTHGTLGVDSVGRIVGLVALSSLRPEEGPVPRGILTSAARHFVVTSGAEGSYIHQAFFGGEDNETVGKWMRRHHVKFSSSLVMEFGKEPVVNMAPEPHSKRGSA